MDQASFGALVRYAAVGLEHPLALLWDGWKKLTSFYNAVILCHLC